MAAGDEEKEIGERQVVGEPRREGMALEVVHGDELDAGGERDRLGRRQPDDDAADQARSGGCRDAVEPAKSDAGLAHGSGDHPVQRLDMGARRDLRHDPAERQMIGDLRKDDVGENPAAAVGAPFDHRRRRLVAARLDAEDDHAGRPSRRAAGGARSRTSQRRRLSSTVTIAPGWTSALP